MEASVAEEVEFPLKSRQTTAGKYTCYFASDGRGVLPLSVALWSLIERAEESTTYDVRILSDGIPKQEQVKIKEMVKRGSSRHDVTFYEVEEIIPEGLKELQIEGRWPRATWARIFAGDLFPDVHRALYMDIDVLCCVDLTPLFELDMHGATLAMVREHVSHEGSHFNERLHIPLTCPGYFNAGVMLVDLDRFRTEKMKERILEYVQRNKAVIYTLDQDAINGALCESIMPLHPRWNWSDGKLRRLGLVRTDRACWKGYPLTDSIQAALQPGIMHYMGVHKPWLYNYRIDGKRYEDCMRRAGLLKEKRLPGFRWGILLRKILRYPLCVHARWNVRRLARKLNVGAPGGG